jgi:tRNA(fMet)-specific endonuclease VapC
MRYLLDADTISFLIRRNPRALARLARAHPSAIAISVVTLMEIEYGLARQPLKRPRVEAFLAPLLAQAQLLPFLEDDARAAAHCRASLDAQGQPIGAYDLLIAGTAFARGLTVVSGNIREYRRVAGLPIEDWRS